MFIVEPHKEINYGEIIARFDLCKIGYDSFYDIFKTPIEYEIFAEDNNHKTNTDNYGDHIKSADFSTVIDWLETNGRKMNYRRIAPFLAMLKGFDLSAWKDLEIVHYGY